MLNFRFNYAYAQQLYLSFLLCKDIFLATLYVFIFHTNRPLSIPILYGRSAIWPIQFEAIKAEELVFDWNFPRSPQFQANNGYINIRTDFDSIEKIFWSDITIMAPFRRKLDVTLYRYGVQCVIIVCKIQITMFSSGFWNTDIIFFFPLIILLDYPIYKWINNKFLQTAAVTRWRYDMAYKL